MKIVLAFAVICFSHFTFAYEVGDTVIYHDSATTMKGKIVAITSDGDDVELDFGNDMTNIYYSGFHSVYWNIKSYEPVKSYTFRPYSVGKKVTFKVGDYAMYEDSATTMKGRIVDLTKNGYVKLDFGNFIYNSYYGKYHSIKKHLSPYKE